MSMSRDRVRSGLAAAAGAVVFAGLDLPLPLLIGPMLGCLAAALAGQRLADMGPAGTFLRTWLGVAIGASITPDFLRALPAQGPTLALVPLFVAMIGAVGYPYFRKLAGFDHPTAFYAAMPGGLQDMLVFGQEAGGDLRAMSLVHATRIMAIVLLAPVLLHVLYGTDLTRAPGQRAVDIPPHEIGLMLAAGLAGWRIAVRVGLFGASILGPMIAAAALSLAGLIQSRPPAEMIWAAQVFIGIGVGSKYTGITMRELRAFVGAGLGYAAILAVISLAFIEVAIWLSPAPDLDAILAFLPGGQAEMAVIAVVAGADVAFVVAHHLVRILVVILAAPLIAAWMARR